jgi:hypothetical protein
VIHQDRAYFLLPWNCTTHPYNSTNTTSTTWFLANMWRSETKITTREEKTSQYSNPSEVDTTHNEPESAWSIRGKTSTQLLIAKEDNKNYIERGTR